MTKKLVAQALDHYLNGDTKLAEQLLSEAGAQFVRKRLMHLVQVGELSVSDAQALWTISFPLQRQLDCRAPQSAVGLNTSNAISQNDVGTSKPQFRLNQPRRAVLNEVEDFLSWASKHSITPVRLDDFEIVQPWALVALAALARTDDHPAFPVAATGSSSAGRFGLALGFLDVVYGSEPHGRPEQGRTVKLHRITKFASIEPVAAEISRLIVSDAEHDEVARSLYFDHEETQRTIYYVLVELMRNVIQHSQDPRGGVIVAQSMTRSLGYDENPAIQVAVADTGIGVYAALRSMHTDITSPTMALERSLWPYFSGTFDATQRGSSQNAGLGLFFVSEMAKLTGGRLLLASRGGTLLLEGDPTGSLNRCNFISCEYPGTLVVFEIPKRAVADYDGLIKTITSRAEERASKRRRTQWIRYDTPPSGAYETVVAYSSENTAIAENVAKEQLTPRLAKGTPIILNFANVAICTQSFIHALLFEPLRVSWATRTPVYVKNASDSVRDGLRLLESYALSDGE